MDGTAECAGPTVYLIDLVSLLDLDSLHDIVSLLDRRHGFELPYGLCEMLAAAEITMCSTFATYRSRRPGANLLIVDS